MNELITGLNGGNVPALDIIMLLTFAALLPSIVVMMSSFMRIIIILSFTRNAMGVQQTPPNMVLTGMALFLSLYIMSPVIGQINTVAYEPYKNGEITQQEAVSRMADPLKQFMLRNTEKDTLDHFVQMSKQEVKKDVKEYPRVCEEKSVIKIFYDNDWGWKLVPELASLVLYITGLSGHVKSRRKFPPVLLEIYGLFW